MENKYEITIDYYKFIQTWGWVVDVKSNKMLRYMSTSKRMRDPSIKKKRVAEKRTRSSQKGGFKHLISSCLDAVRLRRKQERTSVFS